MAGRSWTRPQLLVAGGAALTLPLAAPGVADWAGYELTDFTGGNGIDTSVTPPGPSLFLVR